MIINTKTYIRHINRPEWGLGKVTQVLSQNKSRANFKYVSLKTLIYSPDFIHIETSKESSLSRKNLARQQQPLGQDQGRDHQLF